MDDQKPALPEWWPGTLDEFALYEKALDEFIRHESPFGYDVELEGVHVDPGPDLIARSVAAAAEANKKNVDTVRKSVTMVSALGTSRPMTEADHHDPAVRALVKDRTGVDLSASSTRGRPKWKVTPALEAEILQDLSTGLTISAIARKHGLAPSAIRKIIKNSPAR
jgi:hypothetical protein